MTIAGTDREVRVLIKQHHIYGAETIINALVRAAVTEPHLTKDAIIKMVEHAFERESTREATT